MSRGEGTLIPEFSSGAGSARRISLRSAIARLNSTLTSDHASALRCGVQHHAQDAVDAEPGVPEAGISVVHFAFGPLGRPSGLVADKVSNP